MRLSLLMSTYAICGSVYCLHSRYRQKTFFDFTKKAFKNLKSNFGNLLIEGMLSLYLNFISSSSLVVPVYIRNITQQLELTYQLGIIHEVTSQV